MTTNDVSYAAQAVHAAIVQFRALYAESAVAAWGALTTGPSQDDIKNAVLSYYAMVLLGQPIATFTSPYPVTANVADPQGRLIFSYVRELYKAGVIT